MSDSLPYEKPGPVEDSLRAAISPTEEIIADARAGKMFILVDHEDRENEGDFVIAAEFADAAAINFMATHGRGLICLPMTSERIDHLGLPMMAVNNSSRHETAFTVSIEAREGVTTGISAAGVICEIMKEDGTMARLPDLVEVAQKHDMKIGTISDLIAYRHKHDNLVREVRRETIHSSHGGEWEMALWADQITGTEHVVLTKGDVTDGQPVLARTHALNALEDVLGVGLEARGGAPTGKLPRAMEIIAAEGRGAVFLFRQPRPTLASEVEDDDAPRTIKQTGLGAQIMSTMGIHELILVTDSPNTRYLGLDAYGISIVGTHPLTEGDA